MVPFYYTVVFFEKPYAMYTYQYSKNLNLCSFVKVSFGRSTRIGLVWSKTLHPKTDYEIKSILEIMAQPCFSSNMLDFLKFAQKYYKAPWQDVLQTALPSSIRKFWIEHQNSYAINTLAPDEKEHGLEGESLSSEQAYIVSQLIQPGFERFLIFGVTGSGKTRCYLEAARHWLKEGNVLYLVPEIHLSHQVIEQIEKSFSSKIVVYHSQLSTKKRWEAFLEALNSDKGVIFVAARSGIFLPLKNLKMIIIDEEHDPSYKQQEGSFRYHARDLALFLAQQQKCVCVLGSATPTPKFLDPQQKIMQCFELNARATGFPLPVIEPYSAVAPTMKEPLDPIALKHIRDVLKKKEQVLIYLNQRGYSPRLYCKGCKSFASCPGCLTPLVYHQDLEQGVCHHCGWSQKYSALMHCLECQEEREPLGFGTERLADFLKDVFPNVVQYRFDSDCVKTVKQVKKILTDLQKPGPALIIGTQMISKGHDWPYVTLAVLMVGAFQMKEQFNPFLVQQILQTAGRSGRHAAGRVIMPIVHEQMGMNALEALDHHKYLQYAHRYQKEHIEMRMHGAKIFFQARSLEVMLKEIRLLAMKIEGCEGPFMDYPPKRGLFWRAFVLILRPTRSERHRTVDSFMELSYNNPYLKKSFLSIEIDPLVLY
jgi:primosomal protein N' (replication factor Y)